MTPGTPLRARQGRAKVFGEALVGQGAEPLKQAPMALEIGPEHFGDGQDIVAVGYRRHQPGP